MSKSLRGLCVSFSRADSGFCIYHLFVWTNLNFLHNSQWITFPTQSCLVLCSFLANLLYSLIIIIIIIIIIYSFEFFSSALADGLSLEFEWQQVSSRILLSILAVLNNVVVWMVYTRPPTSNFSSPFSNSLVTVPNAPITIGIIVTGMFHSFCQFPSKVEVLILLFIFFQFYPVVRQDSKVDNFASSLFLLIIIRSGLLAEIRWSVCVSKSHRSLCVDWCWVLHIPFVRMVKFKFLAHLPVDSFCANLLHSFIMWLMVSSLSLHSLHLLFCYVSLSYDWFLRRCFVLLIEEILFLS